MKHEKEKLGFYQRHNLKRRCSIWSLNEKYFPPKIEKEKKEGEKGKSSLQESKFLVLYFFVGR